MILPTVLNLLIVMSEELAQCRKAAPITNAR